MIRKMRLKFFFVTAAICVVLISVICFVLVIVTNARNEQNFREIEQNWQYNPAFENPNQGPWSNDTDDRPMIVKMRSNANRQLIVMVMSIGGGSLLLLLPIAWFLAHWIVRPAEASLEKQQRFVAEAGHELRTPITIISTGVDLLQSKRQNEDTKRWLDDIKIQTERMSAMTTDLLALSRLDETKGIRYEEFNLSQTVSAEILSFESVAFEQHKQITGDVAENIMYRGDRAAAVQAVGILFDNAIKHSPVNAEIEINLVKAKRIKLTMANKTDLEEDEIENIFERFYRGRESRARTAGTGLGLAILKSLCEKQKWEVTAKLDRGKICFSILF
jgi:signal transduction histidine kinase